MNMKNIFATENTEHAEKTTPYLSVISVFSVAKVFEFR